MLIRQATREDLPAIIAIEAVCFPSAEAAQREDFEPRFAAFAENFFVAQENERVIGFINGGTTDDFALPDALYHDASLHNPNGSVQTVFGLDVLPECRRQGVAGELLRHLMDVSRSRGKKGIVLTCKDHLKAYYEKFGFVCRGVSASNHGGAKWNDMVLVFER